MPCCLHLPRSGEVSLSLSLFLSSKLIKQKLPTLEYFDIDQLLGLLAPLIPPDLWVQIEMLSFYSEILFSDMTRGHAAGRSCLPASDTRQQKSRKSNGPHQQKIPGGCSLQKVKTYANDRAP